MTTINDDNEGTLNNKFGSTRYLFNVITSGELSVDDIKSEIESVDFLRRYIDDDCIRFVMSLINNGRREYLRKKSPMSIRYNNVELDDGSATIDNKRYVTSLKDMSGRHDVIIERVSHNNNVSFNINIMS